ncbi:lipoprotein [Mycoplasmopsis californica]|uniref:Lipoprotein n=1 Tax=Mycoplasmopsis californica TaxID=2113 RepID=A0A059XW28_9BACT|nr:hypothetical protein [Mycoplasmopsis californica]AIA29541.1 lipoprotein [Mycoplasmopsis californica]
MLKKIAFLAPISIMTVITTLSCNHSVKLAKNEKIVYKTTQNNSIYEIFTFDQLKIINDFQPIFSKVNNQLLKSSDITFKNNDIYIKNKYRLSRITPNIRFPKKIKLELKKKNDFVYIEESNKSNLDTDQYQFLFKNYDYIFKTENIDWPGINNIFSRIAKSALNDDLNILIPNFIPPSWIRAKAWIKNNEQIEYWEKLILLELKRFDFGQLNSIEKVKITPVSYIEKVEGKVLKNAPVIKIDFLDKDNKSLLPNEIRQQEWIIGNIDNLFLLPNNVQNRQKFQSLFKDYNSKSDFNHTLDIDDDQILFNEYINPYFGDITILKYRNKYTLNDNQYELYVNPQYNFNHATARSFAWFLKNQYSNFEISVPQWRKNIDAKYTLKNVKINNKYLNGTQSLIELDVEVTRINGTKKMYKWYSIDINAHYHTFAQYKTSADFDWNSNLVYGWNEKIEKDIKIKPKEVVDPNVFYEKILPKLMSIQIYRLKNYLALFNNRPMDKYEAHLALKNSDFWEQFKTKLGIDIFKYLVGTSIQEKDWVDDFAIQIIGLDNQAGSILVRVDLLDKDKKSLLNTQNRTKILRIGGFNGYDFKLINEQIAKYNIEEINLEYLIKNRALKLKNPNNIVDFVTWKDKYEN